MKMPVFSVRRKNQLHSSAFIEGAAHHGQPRCQLQDGCLDLSVPDQQMFHDVSNYHD